MSVMIDQAPQNTAAPSRPRTYLDQKIGPSCLVGLIGDGIQASRTPPMHEREGALQGLRYIYRKIDTELLSLGQADLAGLLTSAERCGFAGLNITHPFKQTVIPLLDELSDDARALGAVNTVVFKDGRRFGHNTDWYGFAESFRRGLPDVPKGTAVQLGAGGAGAAVAHAALTVGVERLFIHDVMTDKARHEVDSLNRRFGTGRAILVDDLAEAMDAADGLIHCTPTGMAKHPGLPLPAELLRPDLWVAEIVYFPLETELLRTARAIGCRTQHGGYMAVYQAVEAFRLFSGTAPDAERMIEHFNEIGRT